MYQFEENSTVCFFGDSITFNGHWLRRIYSYYRNVLGKKFELYNCGVPGNTATEAFGRMDETLLNFNPTDVVIMFGMNDVGGTYGNNKLPDETIITRRRNLDNCLASIKDIALRLDNSGIRIIFCTPTPYDELAETDEPARIGVAASLTEISGRIKSLADRFGGHVVDFNSEIYSIMKTHFKDGFSVISNDRVHPTPYGHELMAQMFLKAQGFDIEVKSSKEDLEEMNLISFDPWEEKRFEAETKAKDNDFVNRALYPTIKNYDIIKKLVKDNLNTYDSEYIRDRLDFYLKNEDKTDEYIQKLIKYTKTIYK